VIAKTRTHLRYMITAISLPALFLGGVAQAQVESRVGGETPSDEYARILQQISDTQTNIARREVMLARQEARIASLREQADRLPNAEAEITPILAKFAAGLERSIESDIPFQLGERFERFNSLQELLGNEEASLGEKMARALAVANVEATYGYEIVAYEGDHPSDPRRRYAACEADIESRGCTLSKELRGKLDGGASLPQLDEEILDGDYVRYGRLSMAYIDKGTDDILVWDPTGGEGRGAYRDARGSELAGIRRNLRVARGEAAPDVIEVPVVVTN